jgi:hypothetical protein
MGAKDETVFIPEIIIPADKKLQTNPRVEGRRGRIRLSVCFQAEMLR